ncbi:MAG: DUF1573 domain-containing protein [Desulfobacterales bacterium]
MKSAIAILKAKKIILFVLSAALACTMVVLLSCDKEERLVKNEKKEFPFYLGKRIEPVHSKSYIDQPHSTYEFEPVLQGDILKHAFIIKNNTSDVLEIKKAEGCCGCIVESSSKKIQPGLSGRISTLILTESHGGETIEGTVRATTNDKNNPEITIDVKLPVRKFADIDPYRIWMKGSYKNNIVETSTVIPGKDYPFNITDIKVRKGIDISYSWKKIEKQGRKAYEITVKNLKKEPGTYRDVLFVQTDHSARPEFRIRIEGRITE